MHRLACFVIKWKKLIVLFHCFSNSRSIQRRLLTNQQLSEKWIICHVSTTLPSLGQPLELNYDCETNKIASTEIQIGSAGP